MARYKVTDYNYHLAEIITIITAKMAAERKDAKYATLRGTHLFQPVVVESLGTGKSDFIIPGRAGSLDFGIIWR